MDAVLNRPVAVVVVIALLLGALVGIQGVAAATAPSVSATDAGKLLGATGFAYLGGLRTFAAAVLWNRLEPQFHEFYATKSLGDMTFLLPSLYLVQRLDPNFVQAYYNAAFILAKRGQWDEAYRVAEDGIANNPTSGLMRANYVQLLLLQDKNANLDKAFAQALQGSSADATYESPDDEFESVAVFRTVFSLAGREDLVAAAQRRLDELGAAGAQATGLGHDHDGDGNPDH